QTNANGDATVTDILPVNLLGKYITATMTDNHGDTSEFAQDVQVTALVPTLSSLSSTSVVEGATAITVNGGGFVHGAAVLVTRAPLATTFISASQLQATLPTGLEEGAAYSVTVTNPAPGGGTSSALALAVTDATISASGVTLLPTEAGQVTGVVASFTDAG